MSKYLILVSMLFVLNASCGYAQSLDIPVKGYGISFGNSKNFTGLRFNLIDKEVETITGLNVTLFMDFLDKSTLPEFIDQLNGIGFSPFIVRTSMLNGISVGGVFVSHEELNGISIGGGFAIHGEVNGLALNGMGALVTSDINGVSLSGIATIAYKDINGIVLGGLGVQAEGKINGLALGGMLVEADRVNGMILAPFTIAKEELTGIQIGLLTGFEPFGFKKSKKVTGLSIGLFNYAEELNGIQIGLINYAGNNPSGLKILPGINMHFDF